MTPEESQQLQKFLSDREWRLDNLYHIQDAQGRKIRFIRNEAQRTLWLDVWYLNVILKARQLGFSTYVAILFLDTCLFNSNTNCGIIDSTLDDAKSKLGKIKFAYENLPEDLKKARPLVKENTQELEWDNNSSVVVGTSHRGGTLQMLHVSEYGIISAERPDRALEIRTGAFGTIHKGQMIFVESTAKGSGGEFYDLVTKAQQRQHQGKTLTEMDFKIHFFPWWKHPDYHISPQGIDLTDELIDYFDDLEGKHDLNLTDDQIAWYVKKLEQLGDNREEMFREYPSIPEEAFFASVEGAYFKRQMTKARVEGRIGPVPHDESTPVNTFWDIGIGDQTCIWWHQTDGFRHRLIDYYEMDGEGLSHFIRILKERAQRRNFVYGEHFGPHDLANREWSSGKSRLDTANELGFEFSLVPRTSDKNDAIEAARHFLNIAWIDERHCSRGIQCLDNYRKEWDERRACYRPKPLHDWASHGADALMTGASGFVPEISGIVGDRDEHMDIIGDHDRNEHTGY